MIDTESKIIESAREVFLKKGLEHAKMQDIADAAGISRTSLNYYYRTKENLFQALVEQIFDSILPQINLLSASGKNIDEQINAVIDIYFKQLLENEYMPRFVFVEIQRNPQLLYDFVANSSKAQTYLGVLGFLLDKISENSTVKMPKNQLICIFFGLVFSPFLLNPLLELYWNENKEEKEQFFENHKNTVKRMMKSYFRPLDSSVDDIVLNN